MFAVAGFLAGLSVALTINSFAGGRSGVIPQQIILYKDAARPLLNQSRSQWLTPAAAYTAITVPANFDVLKEGGARVYSASVQAVWMANSPGFNTGAGIFVCPSQPNAGAQLVGCRVLAYFAANDSGPAYYTPGCSTNPGGPFPCRRDVTEALQELIEEGRSQLYFVGVAYGNGTNGPSIFDLEILINWEIR